LVLFCPRSDIVETVKIERTIAIDCLFIMWLVLLI
jgi:hypothetical protein